MTIHPVQDPGTAEGASRSVSWNPRSQLVVPGNRPERFATATTSGADVVAIDLQDSVPPSERPAARRHAAAFLAQPAPVPLAVRVTAVDHPGFGDDIEAVVGPGLAAIALPDVMDAEQVRRADALIGDREECCGMQRGAIRLLPSTESARGLTNLREILAASGRVSGVDFPAARGGDLVRDLGVSVSDGDDPLLFHRSLIVLEARARGLHCIMDSVWVDLDDLDGLFAASRRGRAFGYTGRTAIHPRQVEVINRAYSPTDEETAEAEEMILAFRSAEAEGAGAIRFRGRLVDYAMIRHANDVIARAAR